MEVTNIKEVLQNNTVKLRDILVDGILNQGLLKTGTLARSVQVNYVDEGQTQGFRITMENYGIYQDSGINGTRSSFTPNSLSFFPQGKFRSKVIGGGLPFAVRKSIAEKGFRPRPFIVPSVSRLLQNLQPDIIQAGVVDIEKEIRELFEANGARI